MSEFVVKRLWLERDVVSRQAWEQLLQKAALSTTEQVDYTIGIYHASGELAATGSLDGNILKCLVVCQKYQSENLLTQLVMALLEELRERGFANSFVYTKPKNKIFFQAMGYRLVAETVDLLFMEQGIPTFQDYEHLLQQHQVATSDNSAIVMNANPFTLGHQYLVETAAQQSQHVFVFVVSEDRSEVSSNDRLAMVQAGVSHLANVTVLPTRDYMVSSTTFPAYFLKERADLAVAQVQARLDATLFKQRIAPLLNIKTRYVGEEPFSPVTEVYNEAMGAVFEPELQLQIIKRRQVADQVISATRVRQAMQQSNHALLTQLVPDTTYQYLVTHHLVK